MAMPGSANPQVFEITRIVLYVAQWFMGVVVWGATADKLDNIRCHFGRSSNCGAVIFFGVLATCLLTAIAIKHLAGFFSEKFALDYKHELIGFCVLAAIWSLVSLIVSTGSRSGFSRYTNEARAVVIFSWANVFASVFSGAIAHVDNRQASDAL